MINSDGFKTVVDELTSNHLAALVACPPGDRGKDARDYHHLMQHAFTEIVGQLKGWVEAGEAAERTLAGAEDDDL